jgi:hypothetical protein
VTQFGGPEGDKPEGSRFFAIDGGHIFGVGGTSGFRAKGNEAIEILGQARSIADQNKDEGLKHWLESIENKTISVLMQMAKSGSLSRQLICYAEHIDRQVKLDASLELSEVSTSSSSSSSSSAAAHFFDAEEDKHWDEALVGLGTTYEELEMAQIDNFKIKNKSWNDEDDVHLVASNGSKNQELGKMTDTPNWLCGGMKLVKRKGGKWEYSKTAVCGNMTGEHPAGVWMSRTSCNFCHTERSSKFKLPSGYPITWYGKSDLE